MHFKEPKINFKNIFQVSFKIYIPQKNFLSRNSKQHLLDIKRKHFIQTDSHFKQDNQLQNASDAIKTHNDSKINTAKP